MNTVDQIQKELLEGKLSLRHLELAYIGYMRYRKDLPEGVRNQFVGANISRILRFSDDIGTAIGIATLSYYRGKEGKEEIECCACESVETTDVVKRGGVYHHILCKKPISSKS